MDYRLEVCVDSIDSAINAFEAGADRIELCYNLPEGGTTPGFGIIASVREKIDLPLQIMVRPRAGDFLYSKDEFEIMKKDIRTARELGVDGAVLGILKSNGEIDYDRTAELVELAHPLNVTFSRAFDLCSDPLKSLEDIIKSGAARLLTSGQADKAENGIRLICDLVTQSGSRFMIMPGSGISPLNIEMIAKGTGAREFHLTGRKTTGSKMIYRKEGISMGGIPGAEYSRKVADLEQLGEIIHILKSI
jgi:copper homeostasis protein